jgi:hypothetical protein
MTLGELMGANVAVAVRLHVAIPLVSGCVQAPIQRRELYRVSKMSRRQLITRHLVAVSQSCLCYQKDVDVIHK